LTPFATTPNQIALASYLDQASGTATGDLSTALTQLTLLSPAQLGAALNQLSGEIYPSMGVVLRQTTTTQLQLLSNRLAMLTAPGVPAVSSSQRPGGVRFVSRQVNDSTMAATPQEVTGSTPLSWTSWAQGYGLGGNVSGDANATGVNYQLGGTLFGVERWLNEAAMVGVLGSYSYTSVRDRADSSNAQINSYQVGLYELLRQESFYLSNVDAFGQNNYNVTRPISIGGVQQTAKGSATGNQFAHYSELGKSFELDDVKVQPFCGLQYIYLDQRALTESGAGSLDLTTSNQAVNSFRNVLGARVSAETSWEGIVIIPTLAARYQHEWGNGAQVITSSLSGVPTAQFVTTGTKTGRDFGIFSAGFTAYVTEQLSIFGSADAQVATGLAAVIGSGGLQYSW
jgi:uncharacterized protein with beta-barrel porin domain